KKPYICSRTGGISEAESAHKLDQRPFVVPFQIRCQGGLQSRPDVEHMAHLPTRLFSPLSYSPLTNPLSVMIAVMYLAGVTSKAGLRTVTPSGAMGCPQRWVTSWEWRSSIGISSPLASVRSRVDIGAAT